MLNTLSARILQIRRYQNVLIPLAVKHSIVLIIDRPVVLEQRLGSVSQVIRADTGLRGKEVVLADSDVELSEVIRRSRSVVDQFIVCRLGSRGERVVDRSRGVKRGLPSSDFVVSPKQISSISSQRSRRARGTHSR